VCGVNQMSQRKALEYFDAIHEVGHTAIIFSRGQYNFIRLNTVCATKEIMFDTAIRSNAEFFITCNDNLAGIVAELNKHRNKPFLPGDYALKSNLGKFKHSIPLIETWETLDEVPNNIPIFIKPNNGSGGVANIIDDLESDGDPWTYKKFNSKDHFIHFLINKGGLHRFEYAQNNPGSMGKYVIQEYIEHEEFMNYNYLNDGISKLFSYIKMKRDYKSHPYTWIVNSEIDEWEFAQNGTWGTFLMMQTLLSPSGPKINDINLRCSALLPIFHKVVCPNFYTNFFNNLLNNKQERYEWVVNSWSIIPHHQFSEWRNIQFLPSYDFYDKQSVFGLVLHD
jgi:hypothetical protein